MDNKKPQLNAFDAYREMMSESKDKQVQTNYTDTMTYITSAYREMNAPNIKREGEDQEIINEALIVLGARAYPKFGQVVIMAGGSGSGKGFVVDNLLAVQGKIFDVDELKSMAVRMPMLKKRIKIEYGLDVDTVDLRDPKQTAQLHSIMSDIGIKDSQQQAFTNSVITSPKDRKPNLIFDVTLKDIKKLREITEMVSDWGYEKVNIHIVWVISEINTAIKRNSERSRSVPIEILIDIHNKTSNTMNYIVNGLSGQLAKYMDGDIVFVFNKVGIDNKMEKSDKGGHVIFTKDYFTVKKAGQAIMNLKDIEDTVMRKVASYVPKNSSWI